MALHRPDPAALRQDDRDRLLLDHRRPVDLARRRDFLDPGAAFVAELVLAAPARSLLQPASAAAPGSRPASSSSSRSLASAVALPADLHLLELAQAAQAHVEDRFGLAVGQREFRHHHWLGLVLGADDLDHPVEVEVGDQEAVEQLEPVVDLADPHLAAADQHLDLEREPCGQRLLEAHHPWRPGCVEHVEVEREADLEIGQPVTGFRAAGRDRPCGPRLEDQPHLLVALVLHVGEDRQLLVGDQLRRSARSAWPSGRHTGSR